MSDQRLTAQHTEDVDRPHNSHVPHEHHPPDLSRSVWALRAHTLVFVGISLVQVLIWRNATPDQFFWPLYSILGWGAGVVFHAWFVKATVSNRQLDHHNERTKP